jgi:rod shape determining protein RodA
VAFAGLLLSWLISQRPITTLRQLAQFSVLAGLPAVLIFLEPELGTTIVYVIAVGSVFLLGKTRLSYILLSIVFIVTTSFVGWNFLLHPYQKARITSFFGGSQQTANGTSYNAQQALIAVGSGEVYGRGIGQGVQSHLRFLPERQTDFVFASFAEEMGLLGALPVVLFYAGLVFFILFVGIKSESLTAQYFCFMTATMIAVQSGINIGMNMGLLPITGITLPFFSYGGSSILALCFQIGCVQSILLQYRKHRNLNIQ